MVWAHCTDYQCCRQCSSMLIYNFILLYCFSNYLPFISALSNLSCLYDLTWILWYWLYWFYCFFTWFFYLYVMYFRIWKVFWSLQVCVMKQFKIEVCIFCKVVYALNYWGHDYVCLWINIKYRQAWNEKYCYCLLTCYCYIIVQ